MELEQVPEKKGVVVDIGRQAVSTKSPSLQVEKCPTWSLPKDSGILKDHPEDPESKTI